MCDKDKNLTRARACMRYIQDASLASQLPRRSQQPRAPLCLSLVTRRPLPSRPLSPPSAALAPSRSIAPEQAADVVDGLLARRS